SSRHLHFLHSLPTRRSSDLARVASIMENTNLSKQQQVSEIMRQMLTQAQTAGQYFTNDQIKEMTRKVSAEVDLDLVIGKILTSQIGRAVQQECRDRYRMPSF